ncbi:MAG: hypothetical protein Tsb002_04720 [Wenzhouxiangellaceae bacterium]
MDQESLDKLRLELRRGALVLAVLAQLRQEHYAYSLRKTLAAAGIHIDEGTLYPLVRRLEKQGLLLSEWREEDKRRKRFYRLSADGSELLQQLIADWSELNTGMQRVLANTDEEIPS